MRASGAPWTAVAIHTPSEGEETVATAKKLESDLLKLKTRIEKQQTDLADLKAKQNDMKQQLADAKAAEKAQSKNGKG